MAKTKQAYVCNDCGADFTKWQGQCSACRAWNTLTEVRLGSVPAGGAQAALRRTGYAGDTGIQGKVVNLSEVALADMPRLATGIGELDRVLGGGLVPGSAVLIGGHPGAGKSTLLLQTMAELVRQMPALYVTGEESLQQVAMRGVRLGLNVGD